MNALAPSLQGEGWTGEWGFSFAGHINGLLDPGIPAQGKATKNRVRNGTIEAVVSAEEILARLKAAFERERAANKCQAKRLALLCEHMNIRPVTIPPARGSGELLDKRVGPDDLWSDAPDGTKPHLGEQVDPVVGLSNFVADLLKAGHQIEEPELTEATDEWATLFDTRIKPKLGVNADDDRLSNLNDLRGGVDGDSQRIIESVTDKLRDAGEPGGQRNAQGFELGMQQLGHLLDIGISIEPIPGHSRRSALPATPIPRPLGARAMREWEEARKWKKDNVAKLLEPKRKYRRRDDFDRKAGFELALRRVRSIIRHDPAMWMSLCAAYELLPRRVSDRNKEARDMQVLDWLIEVEERPAEERDRQIVLCWFREGRSEREFAKAKGLPRSTFRDILARCCKLIATRLNERNEIIRPPDQRIVFDNSVVRGVEAIGEVTQRSPNSTMRLIDDPKSSIAMLNGEPAALRKLIQARPYRSRTKAASPCPECNHATPLLAAE